MRILFNYASKSRPYLFKRGIDSIIDNCIGEYEILAILDYDDSRLLEYDVSKCITSYGTSLNKIDAINRGCSYFLNNDFDILVNMSDDMVFTEKSFDCIIKNNFKDSTDQILLFPDGNRHDLITMSIIGRDYFLRDKYIYNPEYKSLYCDNEATEVAEKRGCLVKCYENIFVHLHPAYGKASFDTQYQHTESFNNVDRETYLRRKENNFYL
jgi:hypothetical protein